MPLEFTHPDGHPHALYCRWCRTRRTVLSTGGMVCQVCDGVLGLYTETTPQEQP